MGAGCEGRLPAWGQLAETATSEVPARASRVEQTLVEHTLLPLSLRLNRPRLPPVTASESGNRVCWGRRGAQRVGERGHICRGIGKSFRGRWCWGSVCESMWASVKRGSSGRGDSASRCVAAPSPRGGQPAAPAHGSLGSQAGAGGPPRPLAQPWPLRAARAGEADGCVLVLCDLRPFP